MPTKFYFMRYLGLALVILLATTISCREDEEAVTPPATDLTFTVDLTGYVQKGPFINGTSMIISELNDSLAATGKTFTTQITDNQGFFAIKTSQVDYTNLQLTASGFYFDEVKGEKSSAQLTLFALADVSQGAAINVNVLSHLEFNRVAYLIQEEGKSFSEAKKQAQREVLAIFSISNDEVRSSEWLDIAQEGEDNAILLATSVVLQANNTVAELSELLADLSTDLKEDGRLNKQDNRDRIREQAKLLDLPQVRQHLEKRYQDMDVKAVIPNFEKYIDSDGDGILNKDEDDTPDDFTFEAQVDVPINANIVSNPIEINSLKEGGTADASITHAQLILNGALATDSLVKVANGDKLQIQLVSSDQFNDTTTASLTIGTITRPFRVVTANYSPDDFAFTSIIDAKRSTVYQSDTIVITGLPHPTPAETVWFSTDNQQTGAIFINGKKYTDNSFSLKEGDQVWIEVTAGEKYSTKVSSSLVINDKEAAFEVETGPNSWQEKLPLAMGGFHSRPAGFSIEDKVYFGTGRTDKGSTKAFYEYDPITNQLTQKADFGGGARAEGIGFSIGQFGYIGLGTGEDPSRDSEVYRYDPDTDTWTEVASYPGNNSWLSIGFSLNGKGYVGMGGISNDFWEYDPTTDIWRELASLPAEGRYNAFGFSMNGKGYVGLGDGDDSGKSDIWEYDPVTGTWTQLSNYPGQGGSIGFSIEGLAYIDSFYRKNYSESESQFFKYDPSNGSWNSLDIEDMSFSNTMIISTSTKAYHIRSEFHGSSYSSKLFEFTPPQD